MCFDVVFVPTECRFGLVTVFSGSELRQDKWPYLGGDREANYCVFALHTACVNTVECCTCSRYVQGCANGSGGFLRWSVTSYLITVSDIAPRVKYPEVQGC